MPISLNTGTFDIPLKFASALTNRVNQVWENGDFIVNTSPVTQDLLKFWFEQVYCDTRSINFHVGQRQAILNTIYVHEILKSEAVSDMYQMINEDLLVEIDPFYLRKDKFSHPKYCVKMATGTGKTWVLTALLIWQYLNAKYEAQKTGRFTKNFLVVAPGLIVYERLLDAFLGKETEEGAREFDLSDIKKFHELFIPAEYRDEVFGFIQNNVVKKEDIGKKVTGEGIIAITNWHLLSGAEESVEVEVSALEDPSVAVKEIFPVRPGTSAGHSLESLDNQYLSGEELKYLASFDSMLVFNDEAHHIHEIKTAGEITEVEWQKSLNVLSENKGKQFIQIDFSATPYDVTGSGTRRTKHYFPHILVNFDLLEAIHEGLVKTIVLDRRNEIASMNSEDLDFRAVREGNKAIALSDGQKLMLRAGLQKLKNLEEHFIEISKDKQGVSSKHPKMLVICEDTSVSPLVTDFLTDSEGFAPEDVVQIDSDKKGSIPAKEWVTLKQKLFNIDKHEKPKIIVSVLMLREGFDVNNICVIVPLRSSEAPILLEQILGRGLRQMWREPEFEEIKAENRVLLLQRRQEPKNYIDLLSIIEHPAFLQFYEDLISGGYVATSTRELGDRGSVLGDMITVGLKENYQDYDLYIPVIIQDREEHLELPEMTLDKLESFDIGFTLEQLKKMVQRDGEQFFSEELTCQTRFGTYYVTADLFTAKSYNEFLSKITKIISSNVTKVSQRKTKDYPTMQINQVALVGLIDNFIRNKLFNQTFNPLHDNNWRVLLLSQTQITEFIIKQISKMIYDMQNNINVDEAIVRRRYFSEVDSLRMRENFSLILEKTIYERLSYPSNKGELERKFMLYCEHDSGVTSFLKINERYHDFAHISYIRADGILARYYPDFIVKTEGNIYLVETKAQDNITQENVLQKHRSALNWIHQVNEVNPEDRDNSIWHYVILGENTFYNFKSRNASVTDMLEYSQLTNQKLLEIRQSVEGRLL
ncbi:MAG: DEAD/DEAH box helicase family protein [Candidatus Auribacterota bacterium]|jgi:type III restriction enzyme|nr:DEAD/DEAH box helicase family protein [Candidatus Auribacterota bacterium]